MSKKEIYPIKRTETINLNFYAVRSLDGKWFRNKGMSGRDSWVDDISKARIYSSPGPAKTQITFWAKNYPEYGVPELVQITTGVCNFLDQTERVKKTILTNEQKEIKRQIISNKIKNGLIIEKTNISEWEKYKLKIRTITRKSKKVLIEKWDGYDFYDGEFIKENLSLNHNDKKFPTIDHKISIYYGFKNNISPEIIGHVDNLVFTKREINSRKNLKIIYEKK